MARMSDEEALRQARQLATKYDRAQPQPQPQPPQPSPPQPIALAPWARNLHEEARNAQVATSMRWIVALRFWSKLLTGGGLLVILALSGDSGLGGWLILVIFGLFVAGLLAFWLIDLICNGLAWRAMPADHRQVIEQLMADAERDQAP